MRLLPLLLAPVLAAADLPPNLTAENLPPIPETLRAEASRYLEFRSASFRSWHPLRREMLIGTRFGNTTQIHLVKMPGGARRQLTFRAEPASGGAFRPKTGECFIFAQDTGGGEFYQLYRYDLTDGRVTLLTDGKSRNTGARWSKSGRQLAYASTLRNGKDNDIYVMNPDDPKSARRVFEASGGGWAVLEWSADERRLILGEYLSANESRLHLLDLTTGQAQRLSPQDPDKVVWAGAAFAADERSIFTTTDRGHEFTRLARLDVETRAVSFIDLGVAWDVESFDLSPDGAKLAVVTNEDGASVLRVLDARSGTETLRPKLPVGVIGGVSWHEDSRTLGFSLNAARSPTDAWSLDTESAELTRWTESETGGLDASQFAEPELVRIESFDGLKMSGFLFRPNARKFPGARPCMINIHGGPEGQSRPVFQARYNYFMEELGVALFYPNVRGSEGYGKTFLTLDNGFKREDSVRDIGAFLDALARDPGLDAARFGVMGGSYGGYMTLASMIHHGPRLRCGIDSVGISNFLTFLKNTQDYRRDLRRVEYGDERDPAMAAFLEKISPTKRAAEIKKPLFIVQGKNDPRVPVTEARQMVEAVRAAGGTVAYLEAADEGHGFAKKANADALFLAEVAFLREHLLK
jgi:dipeptidyl aminopeptidase/acylaminoacyl peptidase